MQRSLILNDLMMLSPAIDVRINDLNSSAVQDSFDMVMTTNMLLNEAFTMLITMLDENGICFHVDIDTLMSDTYNIEFVMTLYRQFTPQAIDIYLKNNIDICRSINANIINISSDEFIVHLLEAVKDTDNLTHSKEMYTFLHDKVYSTEAYSTEVTNILNKTYTRAYADTPVTITDIDMIFLMKLAEERKWYQMCMNELMYHSELSVNYKQSSWLASQFRSAYGLPENINILSRYVDMIGTNSDVIETVMQRIRKGSDFYADHYSDEGLQVLSLEMVIGVILAQLSDKRLFGIEPDFTRLIENNSVVNVSDILRMISTKTKVN